uniref:PDZ domain containing 3a n=1 Tax=Erpetoichthys calabaricus TaxID=27687 RepID=A0A8C4XGQ9_ERPCA
VLSIHVNFVPSPRRCRLKRSDEETFGFCLRLEEATEGHVIRQVEPWSLAERSGLQDGDRVLEINGVFVDHLEHNKVRKCHNHVALLVIDSASEESYTRRGITIVPAMAKPSNLPHFPHKLFLTQGPEGYGFLLRQERTSAGRIGETIWQQLRAHMSPALLFASCFLLAPPIGVSHFLQEVDQESPAEHAGMCDGDLLLAVNGDPVEGVDHEDIVAKIRASGSQVTLTVIDCKGSDFYAQNLFRNGQMDRLVWKTGRATKISTRDLKLDNLVRNG